MDSVKLAQIFESIEFIEIGDFMIFKDYEVYNNITGESTKYKTVDDLLRGQIEGKPIWELLEGIEFIFIKEGGRGAGSGSEMGGGFNHASGRGKKPADYGKDLFPAVFNTQGRFATQDAAIQLFNEKYKNSDKEYGISVDEDGFVHKHIQGSNTSVPIYSSGKNHMVVHNHPSGGAFSDSDLLSTAQDSKASGIIATGSKAIHKFVKKKNFNAAGFAKAIKKAKWPAKFSYDKGVKWWMDKNAKTFGFEYKVSKVKN